jgi:hypothetical protein
VQSAQPRLTNYTEPGNRQSTATRASRRMPLTPLLVAKIRQMRARGFRDDIALATLSLFNDEQSNPLPNRALTMLFLAEWDPQRRSTYIASLWNRLEAGR